MEENIYAKQSLQLNYAESHSKGPPMLLLHGATNRWQSFEPIIPELCFDFHVYSLDFRGHGKSHRVPGQYALEHYVEDTVVFITDKIIQPPIILGHSLGGMVAIMLAACHPELVKALIIIDTPLTLDSLHQLTLSLKDRANHLLQGLELSHLVPELQRLIPEHLRQCDPDMLSAMIYRFEETFKNYKIDNLFTQIQCPILLIYGHPEHGSLTHYDDIERILAIKPDLVHVQILQAGHSPIRQDRESTLKAIKQFIKNQALSS